MYGGITQDIIDNVPFMKSIHDYIMEVKDFYQKNNFVETWIYKRRIYSDVFEDKPNPYKVFNYLLQSAETERNCKVLKNILQFINGKQINLSLYTYDAFLFDLHKCEFNSIKDIIKIMNPDDQFPLKLYAGGSYGDLAEIHV
jgi:DNA polymerase I-like protein with 3'-5' exonuclease and polymerase domains